MIGRYLGITWALTSKYIPRRAVANSLNLKRPQVARKILRHWDLFSSSNGIQDIQVNLSRVTLAHLRGKYPLHLEAGLGLCDSSLHSWDFPTSPLSRRTGLPWKLLHFEAAEELLEEKSKQKGKSGSRASTGKASDKWLRKHHNWQKPSRHLSTEVERGGLGTIFRSRSMGIWSICTWIIQKAKWSKWILHCKI